MATEPITITMLGGTRTGKTCFLVSMYGIMRRGVRGFTFAARDLDDDLELASRWKTLRTTTGDRRWPAATDQSKDYEFDFCYAYEPIRSFAWHDYRGGAMAAGSTDTDRRELVERLGRSSCVLLCFSSQHLMDPEEVSEDGHDEAELMNRFMRDVRERARAEGRPLPAVVIVLTKYDLIAAEQKKDRVMERVRELFHPLYAPGGGWTVTTCPVTLGKGLAQDTSGGEVNPISVHLPVSFAVYCAVHEAMATTSAELAARREAVQDALGRTMLGRWWNGINVEALEASATRTQKQLDDLRDKLRVLFKELIDGVQIYHDGEEVEGDV